MVEQPPGTTGRKPRDENLPFAPILPSRQDLRQPSGWQAKSGKMSIELVVSVIVGAYTFY
jgi:hypothetical protein